MEEEYECCGAREEEYNNELDSTFFSYGNPDETFIEDHKNTFIFDIENDNSFFEKRPKVLEGDDMDVEMQNSQQVQEVNVKNTGISVEN